MSGLIPPWGMARPAIWISRIEGEYMDMSGLHPWHRDESDMRGIGGMSGLSDGHRDKSDMRVM